MYMCVTVIIGGGVSSGVILQRFPEKDWPDTPFIEGIEWVRSLTFEQAFERYIITSHAYCVS